MDPHARSPSILRRVTAIAISRDLVGRDRELERLRAWLDRARTAGGAMALITGEPGIGKTRLAEALAALARQSGLRDAWGRCREGDLAPYGPWRDIARDLGAPEVASRVPRVRDLDPEEERLRTHDAFAAVVVASSSAGALLVLDDLHWADAASLAALPDIARAVVRRPVLIVATYRSDAVDLGHPLSRTIAEVERIIPCERLALRGFDADATRVLLERLLARDVPPGAAEAVRRRSDGIPFFIDQIGRQLREEGRKPDEVETAVPEGARQAVAARIGRLSERARDILRTASAFAGAFDLETLRALTDVVEVDLMDAIDETLRADMLRAVGDDAYEFAHVIVRDAIYEDMNPSRRARLHRRVAAAIEHVCAGREREHAAELAFQYGRSAALPGAVRGVSHALVAAAQAGASGAWAERVRLIEMARTLAKDAAPGDRAAILRALAVGQADALDVEAAERTVDEAIRETRRSGDEAALPGYLAEVGWALKDAGARIDLIRRVADLGLELATRRDIHWARLRLLPYPATPLTEGPVHIEVWTGYEPEAASIARGSQDETDRARALEVMDYRSPAELAALRDEVLGWSRPAAVIHGLTVVARSYAYYHCALDEALEVAARLGDRARRHGSVAGQAYALLMAAVVQRDRGAFDEAAAALNGARAHIGRLGPGHRLHRIIALTDDLGVHLTGGDWADLARRHAREASSGEGPGWMRLIDVGLTAYAFARAGEMADAASWLEHATALLQRVPPRTLNANAALCYAALTAWELRDPRSALRLRRSIEATRAQGVGDYPGLSLDHALACVAALAGDTPASFSAFARARRGLQAAGRLPALALAERDEAVARARLEQPLTPSSRRLTGRESAVLRLLAQGRTNQEIATELFVSPHTVERHVANVYAKIGARNRVEAATFAFQHGVARPPAT
jgi:DNA-binding CsgD family transcriptional regulator